jgi:hypothetical protein
MRSAERIEALWHKGSAGNLANKRSIDTSPRSHREEDVMGQREVPNAAEPGELVTERLEAEITTLAAHLTAAECRFLLLVGEFDRREAYLAWGCRTAAFWLSWKCGLDIRSGCRVRRRTHGRWSGGPRVVTRWTETTSSACCRAGIG